MMIGLIISTGEDIIMVAIGDMAATIGTAENFVEDVIIGEDIVSIIIITVLIAIAVTTVTAVTVETTEIVEIVEITGLVNIHRHLAYGITYNIFSSAYSNHNI
jgi:hypothetical protein